MVLIALFALALLLGPYRLEELDPHFADNETRCALDATMVSGWESTYLATGFIAENVRYPLEVFVFAIDCEGISGGRPYQAKLIEEQSGKIAAEGIACGDRPVGDFPCRIEVPPIGPDNATRSFVLEVARTPGAMGTARLEIRTRRSWRLAVFDMIMSA